MFAMMQIYDWGDKMTNEELKAAIAYYATDAIQGRQATLLEAACELSQLKDGTHPDMVMVPRCKEEPQVSKFIHRRIAAAQKGNAK